MIAINHKEYTRWGCPYCGFRSASRSMEAGGAAVLHCADCGKSYITLADDVTVSPIGCGGDDGTVYPKLQSHPREGTPSHGTPDELPEEGGEHFHSRGIGSDKADCFICGKGTYNPNICAFVRCKDAGERVVAMFSHGARMDYREYEPDRVQVKIGACEYHLPALEKLDKLTRDGRITVERVAEARVGASSLVG